jgi:predicted MPP superfamily phosphohydrolase
VFAVLGNHDHWAGSDAVRKALSDTGIRVLMNENVMIRKGRTRLALVGIDDLWTGTADWAAAWRGVPPGTPAVLLSHNPDAALAPEGQRAMLILSGHTHAGKYWVPTFVHRAVSRISKRGFISASRYGSAHPYGLVRERWGWIYITSGITRGYFPPRWFTRPEVAVIELL